MIEHEFYLPSSDKNYQIRCMEWRPEGEVRGVLQITHGMMEHIGRYEEFGVWMAEQGIAVIGHDHLGHGKTAETKEDFGCFGTVGGIGCLLRDIRRVSAYAHKKYPSKKLVLLGHSMGSFLVRRYLSVYDDGPDGFIFMGTGAPPAPLVFSGYILAAIMAKVKGEQYRSKLLYELSLGNYNRQFSPVKTPYDWLTRDEELSKHFGEDPYCQFIFSVGAYRDFFELILETARIEKKRRVRNDAPIFLISGDSDPVGDCGKGVRTVYERYDRAGAMDLTLGLYEGARHEILHELNRREVFGDILDWMEEKVL